ncbi:MAG: hypothetical protein AAGA81_16835 [Acidobacteriota bacterium]
MSSERRPISHPLRFDRYLGIDYSGAATPESRLPGLRVYEARASRTIELQPRDGGRHWSRRALTDWLAGELAGADSLLVGIDHAFSFPLRYFEEHRLEQSWTSWLADFAEHWPTNRAGITVEDVRRGRVGRGTRRSGQAQWRRHTDLLARAKSPFHFDVPGSVAKSTHAGLPLLHELRQLTPRPHFWPFDGWDPPRGSSVLAEAYPSLFSRGYPRRGRTPDQHDAYSIARTLREADERGTLGDAFSPRLTQELRAAAEIEGWILGLPAPD